MSADCCGIARALRQRIENLELALERAEDALKQRDGELVAPNDWALAPQEALLAKVFAQREASKASLLAVMEHAQPTPDGRAANHVSVILHRLRAKLADYGWVVVYARSHCGLYGIHPEQRTAFRAAMTGEGDIAYPAQAAPRQQRIAS